MYTGAAAMSRTRALTLSVLVPVYNERFLVRELLRRVLAVEVPGLAPLEVVVVDDCSTDGTREILRDIAAAEPRLIYVEHERNQGKGAAIRTAISCATGDFIVFQDADLEYDPRDYARLVRPLLEDDADVVYGSRYLPSDRRRVLHYRHTLGNRFLTFLSNALTDLALTDMETCYKVFRAPLLKSIPIRSDRFGIEPELTMKVAKRGCRVFEVPVSYAGRTRREGKKIGWRDALDALVTLLRFKIVDDLYQADEYGSHMVRNLERVPYFNRWLADRLVAHVGARVLEVNAGLGQLTARLIPRDRYVATETNPHHLRYLENVGLSKPYLEVVEADAERDGALHPFAGAMDTVVAVNVLERASDPARLAAALATTLAAGGRLVCYVSACPSLHSRLDETRGYLRRFSRDGLRQVLTGAGLAVESIDAINRVSTPVWWLNGRLCRRARIGRAQLKVFNVLAPVARRLDPLLPWPGLGLVAVARKPGAPG